MVVVDGLADMVLVDQLVDRESHRWWDMVLRMDGGRSRCCRMVDAVEGRGSEMVVVRRIGCVVVVVLVVRSWAEVGIGCSFAVGEDRRSYYVLRDLHRRNNLNLTCREAVADGLDEVTSKI